MKKAIKSLIIMVVLTIGFSCFNHIQADPPLPPGYNQEGNQNPTPQGGGAPIDGGLSFLIGMGVAFGAKKFYNAKKVSLLD